MCPARAVFHLCPQVAWGLVPIPTHLLAAFCNPFQHSSFPWAAPPGYISHLKLAGKVVVPNTTVMFNQPNFSVKLMQSSPLQDHAVLAVQELVTGT